MVDFNRYSAFVLAELLTLLDDLGALIALHAKIGDGAGSLRIGNFTALASSLEELAGETE